MEFKYILTGYYLFVYCLIFFKYRQLDLKYNHFKIKKEFSLSSFKYLYWWIQLSTLFFGIGAINSNQYIFLKIYDNLTFSVIGSIVTFIGLCLFYFSTSYIKENYSPCDDMYYPKYIVKEGCYKYIRHPIYSSVLLIISGCLIITGSMWLLINLSVLIYFYNKSATLEERQLIKAFPEYNEYILKTGKFIPDIKWRKRFNSDIW